MKNSLYKFIIIAVVSLFGCNPKNESSFNKSAAIISLGALPENPILLDAITTSFHPKDSLMTVLYGNQLAYDHAKISGDGNYPKRAVLYNVTWQLQEDEQWFGANIPKNIRNIERLEFLEKDKTKYNNYDSHGIKHPPSDNVQKRIKHIKEMKMAVSP